MSEFWKRKMRTGFYRVDYNHDGILERKDYEKIIDRFQEMENVTPAQSELLKEKAFEVYDKISILASDKTRLTFEDFTEAIHSQIDNDAFAKTIEGACNIVFIILDEDGDGYIQEGDYVKLLSNMSFQDYENTAKFAFASLDIDQDGKVSLDEYRSAVFDFLFSENETGPGALLLGPLM